MTQGSIEYDEEWYKIFERPKRIQNIRDNKILIEDTSE